ncbi:MAG TPA: diphosphate--fructose-6-phosphate 1-phosphotransferase [Rectinema sp.]|nr:diphosphate--fructose-6-phosphate 1-phosphotransferase [Rectinema sp.]HQL16631.1 diphosphate--fructose-6-phosphate 1-phosphotransferase [Rectinema sp.]
MFETSPLHAGRYSYVPKIPEIFLDSIQSVKPIPTETIEPERDREALKRFFPNSYGKPAIKFIKGEGALEDKAIAVGVILSGGPAPGGHNVIAGLFDALKKANPQSRLIGFKGGPSGLIKGQYIDLSSEIVDQYRNTGGFDIIGTGRTKIETPEQFEESLENAKKLSLDALVIIGGDDSNTNAALLSEYFFQRGAPITVVGVPKTIDGDLKNEWIETSFGFDTATRVYSELIGNICKDASSGRKYWHFVKLMGRSASHITLECAFQTRPNVALISEEIEEKQMSLSQVVEIIANTIAARAAKGENFGIVVVPEGLIEFIPEIKKLIAQINDIIATSEAEYESLSRGEAQRSYIISRLPSECASLFSSLPESIQTQLCWDRDPHGNVQVSRIETEKLLAEMTSRRLQEMMAVGAYKAKFDYQTHFFGYEGRCAFPTNFDADYCYSLGYDACLLILHGLTGYIAAIRNLSAAPKDWLPGGIPIVSLMNIEHRHGEEKPVIKKAMVELEGKPFKAFAAMRDKWALSSDYRIPGSIQYFGPPSITDTPFITLQLEQRS